MERRDRIGVALALAIAVIAVSLGIVGVAPAQERASHATRGRLYFFRRGALPRGPIGMPALDALTGSAVDSLMEEEGIYYLRFAGAVVTVPGGTTGAQVLVRRFGGGDVHEAWAGVDADTSWHPERLSVLPSAPAATREIVGGDLSDLPYLTHSLSAFAEIARAEIALPHGGTPGTQLRVIVARIDGSHMTPLAAGSLTLR